MSFYQVTKWNKFVIGKTYFLYRQYSLCTVVQGHKKKHCKLKWSKLILLIKGKKLVVLQSLKFLSKHIKTFKTFIICYKCIGKRKILCNSYLLFHNLKHRKHWESKFVLPYIKNLPRVNSACHLLFLLQLLTQSVFSTAWQTVIILYKFSSAFNILPLALSILSNISKSSFNMKFLPESFLLRHIHTFCHNHFPHLCW